MKSFQTQVLILALALSLLPGITTQPRTATLARSIQPNVMKFSDSTGQSITLGKLGNLLSFRVKGADQNVSGTRQALEGYEIVYREGTQERRIYLGDIAHPELVPISFTSNRKNGEVIKAGDLLRVTAVVETRDGRFRLTHRFEWQAGTTFLWVKRQAENIATSRVDLIAMRSHVAAAGPTPCGPPAACPCPERPFDNDDCLTDRMRNLVLSSSGMGLNERIFLSWHVRESLRPGEMRAFYTRYG